MPAPKAGLKVGAKKVDAESYIPPKGDWEDTNILHDFGDGWLIVEDRSEFDRRLMAKLTLTCVATLIPQCSPGPTPEEQYQHKFNWYMKNGYGEERAKKEAENWLSIAKQTGALNLYYKLGHVRDPEGRPMSCILFVDKEAAQNPKKGTRVQYGDSNDLGQSRGFMIDDKEWLIAELRLGTGKAGPLAVEERVIEWYYATGPWNEEAYLQRQIDRRQYAAITTGHPTNADLAIYRRETVLA